MHGLRRDTSRLQCGPYKNGMDVSGFLMECLCTPAASGADIDPETGDEVAL